MGSNTRFLNLNNKLPIIQKIQAILRNGEFKHYHFKCGSAMRFLLSGPNM